MLDIRIPTYKEPTIDEVFRVEKLPTEPNSLEPTKEKMLSEVKIVNTHKIFCLYFEIYEDYYLILSLFSDLCPDIEKMHPDALNKINFPLLVESLDDEKWAPLDPNLLFF